jgi:hypothetical protein
MGCRSGGIGRRRGLKIPRVKACAGSSPASGTSNFKGLGFKVLNPFLFVICGELVVSRFFCMAPLRALALRVCTPPHGLFSSGP